MSEQFWREFWWFWTMTTIKSSYKSSHDCSERKQWACAPFYNYDDTQSHRFLHLRRNIISFFFILRHQIPYFWYYQQVLKKSSWYISDYSALSALVSVLISGLWQQSYVKWLLKCDLDWGILSNTILVTFDFTIKIVFPWDHWWADGRYLILFKFITCRSTVSEVIHQIKNHYIS